MMTQTTSPAWLPDWRNESEYTDHGDDLEAWRLEAAMSAEERAKAREAVFALDCQAIT